MAVKIRLARAGKKKNPFYRVVAIDDRKARNGQYLEKLGTYNPMTDEPQAKLVLQRESLLKWLNRGALPSKSASDLLSQQGILKEFDASKSKKKKPKKKRKARRHSIEELKKRRAEKALAQQQAKQKLAAKKAGAEEETAAKTVAKSDEEKKVSKNVTAPAKATSAQVQPPHSKPAAKTPSTSEVEKTKAAPQVTEKVAPVAPPKKEKEVKEKKD